ncbi:MAG: helix-turn-helix transcriptional regulator [Alphaproteobacteria bacterium]
MMITSCQLRGARGIANLTVDQLAALAGVHRETIDSFENGKRQPQKKSMAAIMAALYKLGIEFLDFDGVRRRPEGVQILSGREGLISLMEDILDTCRKGTRDIVLSGVSEADFQRALGDYDDGYLANMSVIEGLKMRTLIREGDTNIVSAAYSEYRWSPADQFDSVPFYAYADKLAIVVFSADPSPRIFMLQSRAVADAYRRQFESMWSNAKLLPSQRQ